MSNPTWNSAAWQRLTTLFEQALELAAGPRAALLEELAASEPQMAQTLARMLVLDAGFATDSPPSPVGLFSQATDPLLAPGTQLGVYAIAECVGTGGMGRVYKAHRVEGDVTQTVAIKCLRFPDRDPEFMRRFLRERQILASLQHPNIARFLDAGTDAKGQPYVVLDYVDGPSINQFAADKKLSLAARIELLLQVMSAVAYSHRQLIIHRDIKPGNVLVDASGTPYLLDFGIAKPIAAIAGVHTGQDTALEQRAYSIGHAAPEQLRGSVVGTAADIYALGVLTYELLCGQAPLDLVGLSFVDAQRRVLEEFPLAPSARISQSAAAPDGTDARSWAKALRGDLDNIVLHALKKEPGERYATVDALMEDLRRHLNSEPISLRSSHRWYRAQKFVSRHRLAMGLAASLLIALSAGGIALWQQNKATEIQRDAALAQTRRAEALNGLLLNAFEAADPSRNRGNEVTAREVLDQAARRVNDGAMDPATRVTLLTTVADVYRTLGLSADSAKAAQSATQLTGDIPPLLQARAWRALAEAKLAQSDIEAAEAALANEKIALTYEQTPESEAEKIELALLHLRLPIVRGQAPDSADGHRELFSRAKRVLGAEDALTIRCGMAYAQQLIMLRRPQESLQIQQQLLNRIPDPLRDAVGINLLNEMAISERQLTHFDRARTYAAKYLEGTKILFGDRHENVAISLHSLALLEEDDGRFERAVALSKQSIRVLDALYGSPERDSEVKSNVLNSLARQLLQTQQTDESYRVATEAVRMARATRAPGSVHIAHAITTLADALIHRQAFDSALMQLDASEKLYASLQKTNSPGLMRAFGQVLRAQALLELGRNDEAAIALDLGAVKLLALAPSDVRRQRLEFVCKMVVARQVGRE
jgi:eukaryotic-like serine/threonine-protein kinase